MTKRCAGCGERWDVPTDECLQCGRPADLARVEWKPEWGAPKTEARR